MNASRFFAYTLPVVVALAVICDGEVVNQETARACEADYLQHGSPTVFINCMWPWLGFGELPDETHAVQVPICVVRESTDPLLEPTRECCFGELPAPTGPARVVVTCGPRNRCKSVDETCKDEDCLNTTCSVRRENDVGECQKFATLFEMCWAMEECRCERSIAAVAHVAGATEGLDVATANEVRNDIVVTPKSEQMCCDHFGLSIQQCLTLQQLGVC